MGSVSAVASSAWYVSMCLPSGRSHRSIFVRSVDSYLSLSIVKCPWMEILGSVGSTCFTSEQKTVNSFFLFVYLLIALPKATVASFTVSKDSNSPIVFLHMELYDFLEVQYIRQKLSLLTY